MDRDKNFTPLVKTIKERCKVCFTCIRECPAKAISVTRGQAEVIQERCIGCGNCVRVCSQGAKVVESSIPATDALLKSESKVAACLAPSFPAEFMDVDYKRLVGMLREVGFDYVIEVAAGADIVSREYKSLLAEERDGSIISTTCPAVVSYIEKYYPGIIDKLSDIPSPMLVTARLVREYYGQEVKSVFIGPCIAKKNEAEKHYNHIPVDAVMTFAELREFFSLRNIIPEGGESSDFDPPHPGKGMIFPVTEGLLQSSDLIRDLIENNIVSTSGKQNFVEVVKEFSKNRIDTGFIDILCCNGCIMGPGYTVKKPQYTRHACVSRYVALRLKERNPDEKMPELKDTSKLSVSFAQEDRRLPLPSRETVQKILRRMGKMREEDELNCGACGYETCMEHAIAIENGFAESEMCLPYAIEKFKQTAKELEVSYKQLEETQNALIQSEKLASMGQLAAGIAHEINNPLGVIVLYANLLYDDCAESSEMHDDLKMIVEQANRCKNIVGGLLNFARKNKVLLKKADIRELLGNCLNMVRCSRDIKVIFDRTGEPICADIDLDQITQVFINLISNAIEAMSEGGELKIEVASTEECVEIKISDTGSGIKEELLKKIFEPFFTTKQIGKGTGLGLAVSYGIIKMHHGKISVTSNAEPEKGPLGSTFTVTIPARQVE